MVGHAAIREMTEVRPGVPVRRRLFRTLHPLLKKCKHIVSPNIGCCRAKAPMTVLVRAAESGIDMRPEILSMLAGFFG